ncbi:hypothetical protein VD0002_g8094 [Verticillium dahliae]|uniref:Uncharacterized protein n=1 Tax=Verticillium dahliae TaxID=27337 RepID=A0AA45AK59_VERDA|nr:hypothetical protein BJF96_g6930 [Verticillium dahliae]PNH41161.1 hypothetical protein VD0004_g5940 [Verticillium dahliae]PNH51605.1 hypothetical protein VD0003_g5644 [Verticillium dahliae]PNH59452.1 hypothetical protein VD0002_g8094 [Verticillium dahliae]PNH74536.1 hypothetical protein VD0001_g2999 [Verticillium dahliae]
MRCYFGGLMSAQLPPDAFALALGCSRVLSTEPFSSTDDLKLPPNLARGCSTFSFISPYQDEPEPRETYSAVESKAWHPTQGGLRCSVRPIPTTRPTESATRSSTSDDHPIITAAIRGQCCEATYIPR